LGKGRWGTRGWKSKERGSEKREGVRKARGIARKGKNKLKKRFKKKWGTTEGDENKTGKPGPL